MPQNRYLWTLVVAITLLPVLGCNKPGSTNDDNGDAGYGGYSYQENIVFHDTVKSNASMKDGLGEFSLIDVNGNRVELKKYIGSKNLVLVITRGYAGAICPYCSTQTSRLISNYQQFVDLNAEVVVVYPVKEKTDTSRLNEFLQATREKLSSPNSPVPFPVLLDVELKIVDRLGIRQNLAKPATYILDTEGQVRFAYVGSTVADRPSIKAMLEQLRGLGQDTANSNGKSKD